MFFTLCIIQNPIKLVIAPSILSVGILFIGFLFSSLSSSITALSKQYEVIGFGSNVICSLKTAISMAST